MLSQKSLYTIKDIFALPEGQRAELLDGKLYRMAPPATVHQKLSNYICTEINLYIRKKAGVAPVIYGFDRGIKAGIYDDLEIDLSGMKARRG